MVKATRVDLTRFEQYAPEILKIQGKEGLQPFTYGTRYVQRQLHKVWEKCIKLKKAIRFIILKARRHGISTYTQGRMHHHLHILGKHQRGVTIAANEEGVAYLHGIYHTFYEYLPDELRPMVRYDSKHELTYDAPKSKTIPDTIRKMALKNTATVVMSTELAGLGTGTHFVHLSEYSMYRDADVVRKALMPTVFISPNTFVVIESTANGMTGKGEPFYREWQLAKAGKSEFTPLFFSWLEAEEYRTPFSSKREKEELLDTLDAEEQWLIDDLKASYEQLNWRRHQIRLLGSQLEQDGFDLKTGLDAFHEQYPATDTEAFIVSGNPLFDTVKLKKMREYIKVPIFRGDLG